MSRKQRNRLCVQPLARRGCTSGRVPEIPRDQGTRTSRTSSRLTVAILESEEQQLNTIQGDLPFEVVLDSGAADHVADNVDAPGYSVEPSAGSKAGGVEWGLEQAEQLFLDWLCRVQQRGMGGGWGQAAGAARPPWRTKHDTQAI